MLPSSARRSAFWGKPLAPVTIVHIEEGVAIIGGAPHVEPLAEMLQVVAQPAECLEVDTGEIDMTRQERCASASRLRIEQLVHIGDVDQEVVQGKEDADDVTCGAGILEGCEAVAGKTELRQHLLDVDTPLLHLTSRPANGLEMSRLAASGDASPGETSLPRPRALGSGPASRKGYAGSQSRVNWRPLAAGLRRPGRLHRVFGRPVP